jgi:GNAT superfamily N-acetyltransferase
MTQLTEYEMRRATTADLQVVLDLLAQSARWMHEQGWDAWPPGGFPAERITPGLEEGTVWLMLMGGQPVGTLALDQHPDPEFEAAEAVAAGVTDLLPMALIGHRMAVARDLAGQGLGSVMLRWSIDFAYRQGLPWRLTNVARRAVPLQQFYAREGFKPLATVTSTRTADGKPRKSGSLWGRTTTPETSPHVPAVLIGQDAC